jgi:uncharacterized protein YyaL (SSP411 family)
MKPGGDNATPSGNGTAAGALIALGHLANEPRFVEAGERAARLFAPMFVRSPGSFSTLIEALEDAQRPPTSIVLEGPREAAVEWQRALERTFRPTVRIFNVAGVRSLPAALAKGSASDGSAPTAWVCQGTQCLPPIRSVATIEEALRANA